MKKVTLSVWPDWYTMKDGDHWGEWVVTEVCEMTYEILVQCRDSERKEDRASFAKYISKQLW